MAARAMHLLVLCLAVSSYMCDAFKILVVFPMPSRSHGNLGEGVIRQLLKAGHEVTYVTPFPYKNPPSNLRVVDVSSNSDVLSQDSLNLEAILKNQRLTGDFYIVKMLMTNVAVKTLEHPNVQKLMNDLNQQFDLVLIEWMFSEITSALAAVFDCPLIWLSPVEVNPEILGLVDSMPSPAVSGDFSTSVLPPYPFDVRVQSLWNRIKQKYLYFMYYDDLEDREYKRLVVPAIEKRGRKAPIYSEVRYNVSLMLGNSHVSMGSALTLPQSYKPIAGYHIDEDIKPLPEDLKRIIENAKNGVIYFSMGSNLKSKDWPQEIKSGLLKMFGGLKQTVLWKFEEDLPNVPKNVHILKWAPQPSILSHPNCILFITHGGLLSTTETIHFGVPIIGIPVFGDQPINVQRAVNKGFAMRVDFTYNVVKDLKVAIEEMTANPKYRERAKELSFVYHHRPSKPGAELLHWVEHVAHTRGAAHLRSPALDVPIYQILYLDLVGIIFVILVLMLVILKRLCRVICPSKNVQVSKKKKN